MKGGRSAAVATAAAPVFALSTSYALQYAASSTADRAGLPFHNARAATRMTRALADARCVRWPFISGVLRFVGVLHEPFSMSDGAKRRGQ